MKDNLKKLFKDTSKLTLSSQEKEDIRHILKTQIGFDVREGLLTRIKQQRSQIKTKIRLMPLALALLLTFSGGTALAANGALPGDLLYPVKVGVNEQIRSAIAFTTEAEANYQGDLAARRVAEIEQLAAQGKLDGQVKESAEARFESHADKTLKLIEDLEVKGNFDAAAAVSSRFEASLEAHEELIANISGTGDLIRDRLQEIRSRINSRIEAAGEARTEAEAQISSDSDEARTRLQVVVEAKSKQSERRLNSAKNDFEKYEPRLNTRVKSEVRSKIEAAEDAHIKAMSDLESEDLQAAFRGFQESISLTHQAAVMMKSWVSFSVQLDRRDTSEMDNGEMEDDSSQQDDEGTPEGDDDSTGSSDEENDTEVEANVEGEIDIDTSDSGVDAGIRSNGRVDIGL